VLDRNRILHEVTTFRRDVQTDGRHAVVQYGVTLEEDLARRDFTINAIAYHPIRQEWRDPFGGKEDIDGRLVRAVGDPSRRFAEDYLRILRGLRFAARFHFAIDPATWDAGRTAAPGLAQLSPERVRDEWFKGLQTAQSVTQLAALWLKAGAAAIWIPELEIGPFVRGNVPEPPAGLRDPVLLTALFTATPASVLRRLRASNLEIDRALGMERGPGEPAGIDEPSVRRWLSAVGSSADDLSSLWSLRRGKEPSWLPVVREIRRRGDPLTRSDLAISGNDLQSLGASGPRIGQTLAALLDQVLDEPSLNTREQLLERARALQ
jgi:tRNA nucleotidyltransferase (CCA-adding enzyme)